MPDNAAPRIFVQIASYRDRECQWTVKDLFEKARHPDRVFVGICWQTVPDKDQDCFEVETRPEQVRTVHFDASDTIGVGWARQQAINLWEGEEYLLQIDSHMRFVPDWDEKLFAMLAACDSPDPVLTVYPPHYEPPNDLKPRDQVVVQAVKGISSVGFISFTTRPVPPDTPTDRPFLTASFAAGFLFGPSRIITDVPPDPLIFFNGEEPSMAIRLWTHGFDLYSPNEDVIYHYYLRKESSRPWNDFDHFGRMQKITMRRMRQLCEPNNVPNDEQIDLGEYGIGPVRSFEAYEEFAGVNFAGRTIASYAKHYPYVLTDDVARRLTSDTEVRIAPESQLFIIDEHGFLYTKQKGNLVQLNATAAYVWCALEEAIPLSAIKDQLIANGIGDDAQVGQQLMNLVAHLQGEGALVVPGAPGDAGDGEEKERPREKADPDVLARSTALAGDFAMSSVRLRLSFEDSALRSVVEPLLADIAVDPSTDPTLALSLCRGADDDFLVIEGDEVAEKALRVEHSAFVIRALLQHRAARTDDVLFHIRGGMVSRDGRGTVILDPGEHAKDPLLASLLSRGYALCATNAVLVLRDELRVNPLPMALNLREVDGLGVASEIVEQSVAYEQSGGEEMRLVMPVRSTYAPRDRAVDMHTVVFAHRSESGETAVRPLAQADGLLRLLGGFMKPTKPFSLAEVTRVIQMVEGLAFYELRIGTLNEAAAIFDDVAGKKTTLT